MQRVLCVVDRFRADRIIHAAVIAAVAVTRVARRAAAATRSWIGRLQQSADRRGPGGPCPYRVPQWPRTGKRHILKTISLRYNI